MKEEQLTAEAYRYARKVKKVNEGVIEAYRSGYRASQSDANRLPSIDYLDVVLRRFRSSSDIHNDLGMSGERRGLNKAEEAEAEIHKGIKFFIAEFEEKLKALNEIR